MNRPEKKPQWKYQRWIRTRLQLSGSVGWALSSVITQPVWSLNLLAKISAAVSVDGCVYGVKPKRVVYESVVNSMKLLAYPSPNTTLLPNNTYHFRGICSCVINPSLRSHSPDGILEERSIDPIFINSFSLWIPFSKSKVEDLVYLVYLKSYQLLYWALP